MGKEITFSDYHLNTKVAFRKLEGAFYKNYMTLCKSGLPSHKSPKSDSTYWHDEEKGLVYRCANHWGEVASCIWDIDKETEGFGGNKGYTIGVANIKDFVRIEE